MAQARTPVILGGVGTMVEASVRPGTTEQAVGIPSAVTADFQSRDNGDALVSIPGCYGTIRRLHIQPDDVDTPTSEWSCELRDGDGNQLVVVDSVTGDAQYSLNDVVAGDLVFEGNDMGDTKRAKITLVLE